MSTIQLNDVAFARSGDKGDKCNIGLMAKDAACYAQFRAAPQPRRSSRLYRHRQAIQQPVPCFGFSKRKATPGTSVKPGAMFTCRAHHKRRPGAPLSNGWSPLFFKVRKGLGNLLVCADERFGSQIGFWRNPRERNLHGGTC